jgi:hypothetical protein
LTELTSLRDCKIVNHPRGVEALRNHATTEYEVVLYVRRPPRDQKDRGPDFEGKTFATRAEADRQGEEH